MSEVETPKRVVEQFAALLELLDKLGPGMDEKQTGDQRPLEISEMDQQMFSILISDLLRGVDVAARYPAHFERLSKNAALRAAFREVVEMTEREQNGTLEPLPRPPDRDLSFLHTHTPTQQIAKNANGSWRITWSQFAAQLERIFFLPNLAAEPVFRDGLLDLDETVFELFRQSVQLEGQPLTALLEATQPLETPDILRIWLTLAPADHPMQAHLQWGNYAASVAVSAQGRACFPDLPLAQVMDPESETIQSDLHLALDWGAAPPKN